MDNNNHNNGRFYFLCLKDRRVIYGSIIANTPYQFVFFDHPEDLVKQCLGDPPLAILIDIQTSIRIGTTSLNILENLYVMWPILRCSISKSGFALASCSTPAKRENLNSALDAIARGDKSWFNRKYNRKHIRLDIPCRMRIRKLGNKIWCRGNCLNISSGGFFAVTYDPPEKNSVVEIQLLDLTDEPISFRAKAVWSRKWDDTQQLPGSGIAISADDCTDEFRQALSNEKYIGEFFTKYK